MENALAVGAQLLRPGRAHECSGRKRLAATAADLYEPVGQVGGRIGAVFQILVAHDELDLPPGQAKLKFGGSHAGHNGLRDIHAQLGTGDYWRLRLGIGHPGDKAEVVHWVLKKPVLDHRIALDQCIDRALGAVPALMAGDTHKAMLQIHTITPPRPKLAKPKESEARPTQPPDLGV